MPWRGIKDAYRIWLSEIILQQTQVSQGTDYYLRFLERFPDVVSLALASDDEVMRLWQGLGYYSRARNLHKAAKLIAEQPCFPSTYADIRKLPGVGDYTAAAIASFAFGLPHAALDGNAYRVLSRYFGISEPIDTLKGKRTFAKLGADLLPVSAPADFNSAMMDFGATVCMPKKPKCVSCVLASSCVAFSENAMQNYPVKQKKMLRKTRYFVYVCLRSREHILLFRRGAGDIWQGLYEPLLLEFSNPPSELEVFNHPMVQAGTFSNAVWRPLVKDYKHQLTHQDIIMSAYELSVDVLNPQDFPSSVQCELVRRDEFPCSRLVEIQHD